MVSNSKGWHKIGITANSPGRRLCELREAAPDLDISPLAAIPSIDCERLEGAFRSNFKDSALAREKWQELDPKRNNRAACAPSEWYELDKDQVELFLATAETTGGKQANAIVKKSSEYHARIFKYHQEQIDTKDLLLELESHRYEAVIAALEEENRRLREET